MVFFNNVIALLFCVFMADSDRCYSNTSIPIPMQCHQTAYDSTSHALYLFGGIGLQDAYLNSIYKWEINPNIWTKLSTTTPTTPGNYFYSWVNNAVTIQDIVYFIGIDDYLYDSGKVYRFRLSAEEWLSPDSINAPQHPSIRGCLTHNTSHILMVGGQTDSTSYIDELQIYGISSNVWSTETIDVSPIYGQGWANGYCHSIGVDLYVFGGETTPNGANLIDNIFKYNPNDKWTSIGHLPKVQGYGFAVYNERSRAIYLVGGWTAYVDTIFVFDVDTESITDTWTMTHARGGAPGMIIDADLYVFGGGHENILTPLSSVEICTIPPLITMDPTSNPSATPIRNSSVSPTDIPSKYPTDDPSSAPIHNPSVSPTNIPSKYPTADPSVLPTGHPSHPSTILRADIPTASQFISTADVTHKASSTETTHSTESPEDRTEKSSASMVTIPMWMIGSSVAIVCVVAVLLVCLYTMIRKRSKVDAVRQVERMIPPSPDVNEIVSRAPPTNPKRIEIPDGVVSTNAGENGIINADLVMQGSAKVTQGCERNDSNASGSNISDIDGLWQQTTKH